MLAGRNQGAGAVTPEQVGEIRLRDDNDYLNYVKRCHDEWYNLRSPYEASWYLDVAFYLGRQYSQWVPESRLLRDYRSPSTASKLVINRIKPAVRTLTGKLLQGPPTFISTPTNDSEKARSLARVTERLLKGMYKRCGVFNASYDAAIWQFTTGTGFIETSWDPTLGDAIVDLEGRGMRTGDATVTGWSPYTICVPSWMRNLTNPSKVIHSAIYSVDQIRNQFPDSAKDIRPDNWISDKSFYESRLSALMAPSAVGMEMGDGIRKNCVYRIALWEDPQTLPPWDQDEFPTGRLTIVASDTVLYRGPNPFIDGKHPFTRFRAGNFPGHFWGVSPLDDAIPVQRAINAAASQMQDARKMTASPKLRAPKGHQMNKITTLAGEILEYQMGLTAPEYMTPPPMSPHLAKSGDELYKAFQDVLQVREVSEGGLPAANLTGVGIELLQQSDNTPWQPVATEFAQGLGDVGQKLAARASQGYIEPRAFAVLDDFDMEDMIEFSSDGELLPVLVDVDVTSVLPQSKAARQAKVESLVKLGALDPMSDKIEILRRMEFGDTERLFTQFAPDIRRAMRENKAMARGRPVHREVFDDDEAHLKVLTDFMKGTDFEAMAPEQQAPFRAHYDEHLEAIMQLKMAMQPPAPPAGAGAAQGGVPSKPGGPPPGEVPTGALPSAAPAGGPV